MATELIHIGFGNYVAANHMIGVASPAAAPIKRLIHEGRTRGATFDMSSGHRTKAVLFMKNGAVVLAAISPETIAKRTRTQRIRALEEEGG